MDHLAAHEHGFTNRGTDIARGTPFFVTGWAIDLGRRRIPWDIRVEIDGRDIRARTRLHVARPDVAQSFGTPNLLLSGFSASVETKSLAAGPHELAIRAVVGRLGASYAKIPDRIRFFVHDASTPPLALPDSMEPLPGRHAVDPLPIVTNRGVLEVSGWALDKRDRPIRSIAARIDSHPWCAGRTRLERSKTGETKTPPAAARAGFYVRLGLEHAGDGLRQLHLAGKTAAGEWAALGAPMTLMVATPPRHRSAWVRELIDGGDAWISADDGSRLSRIVLNHLDTIIHVRGVVRWSSPLGSSVTLAVSGENNQEHCFPAWTAPTGDPGQLLFGAEISEGALAPAKYRLFVEATDASERYVGRADADCELTVERVQAR